MNVVIAQGESHDKRKTLPHKCLLRYNVAALTQVELAQAMGVAQSEISRIEARPDMLLSTLAGHLAAAGNRPRVVVTIAELFSAACVT
jgi:predicted transcriptional regulator